MFPAGEGNSRLGEQVHEAMNAIIGNVAQRFLAAGLKTHTGWLADAMNAQDPIVEEFETVGIQAAVGNIGELNRGTPPYYLNKKTGEVRVRGNTPNQYSYEVVGKNADIPAEGYWAFQEFGTSNGVRARNFWLAASTELHKNDQTEFSAVNKWIRERVAQYNQRAAEIMK